MNQLVYQQEKKILHAMIGFTNKKKQFFVSLFFKDSKKQEWSSLKYCLNLISVISKPNFGLPWKIDVLSYVGAGANIFGNTN